MSEINLNVMNVRKMKGYKKPETGDFNAGDIIENIKPDNSDAYAWICIEGGSPGVWETLYINSKIEKYGEFEFIGDGVTRSFKVEHGFNQLPKYYNITPASGISNSSTILYITPLLNDVNIVYDTPPPDKETVTIYYYIRK